MQRVHLLFCGLTLLILTACSSSRRPYNTRLSPEAMQKDAQLAWEFYRTCHPSLDWYTPYDSVSQAFEETIASFTDSLTEQQFRLRLSKAVATIRCGHTSVRPSKASLRSRQSVPGPFFPYQLKVWGTDSMVVLGSLYRRDSLLPRGTRIVSIDGRASGEILQSITPFIAGDGFHNGFRHQLISNNFPAWYRAVYDTADSYRVEYIDSAGSAKNIVVKAYRPGAARQRVTPARRDSMQPRLPAIRKKLTQRNMTIDTAQSLAIMELNTFSQSSLKSFIRQSFRTLRRQQVQNLAIDLRDNGGGNMENSTLLTRFLSDHPFRIADTISAKSFHYPRPGLVQWGLVYKIQRFFVGKRRADGRIHYAFYERKSFEPKKKNHFNGKVFIITGGVTFSACTLFIHPLQEQQNVTVLGEESGGGAYGNSSVNIPDVRLPNTGVRIRLPLYRIVIDHKIPHDGRGIIPDVPVPPNSWYIANRRDPKMETIYALLKK